MTAFHRFLAMLLLAVWLPMTSHCYIEESGILDISVLDITFDQCCSEETAAPVEGDPCDTGCKMVEETGFKFQDDQNLFVPTLFCVLTLPLSSVLTTVHSSVEITRWPPETLRLAQFDACTAVPTRAPSFLS